MTHREFGCRNCGVASEETIAMAKKMKEAFGEEPVPMTSSACMAAFEDRSNDDPPRGVETGVAQQGSVSRESRAPKLRSNASPSGAPDDGRERRPDKPEVAGGNPASRLDSAERVTSEATCTPHSEDVGFCTTHGGHFLFGICSLAQRSAEDPPLAAPIEDAVEAKLWLVQNGIAGHFDDSVVDEIAEDMAARWTPRRESDLTRQLDEWHDAGRKQGREDVKNWLAAEILDLQTLNPVPLRRDYYLDVIEAIDEGLPPSSPSSSNEPKEGP